MQESDHSTIFDEEREEDIIIFGGEKKPEPVAQIPKQREDPVLPQTRDDAFTIRVNSPEKVGEGIMSSHVEYRIDVKTSLRSYRNSEFTAVRRYSDFDWLRERLLENNKGYLIPPLPEKAVLNRFNTEFMEYRRRELERFLVRVTSHPVLQNSSDLQTFFETDSSDSSSLKQAVKKEKTQAEGGKGFFGFISSTAESISQINFSAQNDPDQWFDAKKNYVISLETQMNSLVKVIGILIKRRKDLSSGYADFGLAASLIASAEADNDSLTSSNFNKLADVVSSITSLDEKHIDDETAFFEDAVRDQIRMLGAVKEMLAIRQEKLAIYQNLAKSVEQKREKVEKTKGSSKLEAEIRATEDKLREAETEFNRVSNISRGELQQFEASKLKDIKQTLLKLAQININYELQVADYWKNFLSEVQN